MIHSRSVVKSVHIPCKIGGSRSYVGSNRHISHLLANTHAAANLNRTHSARRGAATARDRSLSLSQPLSSTTSGSYGSDSQTSRSSSSSSSSGSGAHSPAIWGEKEADYRYRTRRVNHSSIQHPRIVHVPTGAAPHVTLDLRVASGIAPRPASS
jgi:hypothetical protein